MRRERLHEENRKSKEEKGDRRGTERLEHDERGTDGTEAEEEQAVPHEKSIHPFLQGLRNLLSELCTGHEVVRGVQEEKTTIRISRVWQGCRQREP